MTDRLHPPANAEPLHSTSSSPTPFSLFEGVYEAASAALGARKLSHRSALNEPSRTGEIPAGVVPAVFEVMERNWNACRSAGIVSRSQENWRWRKPQPQIASHNASPEVRLERAIIAAAEATGRSDWSNQVPVASGVAGPSAERRRAIDLVQQTGADSFAFIELKVASDTPLYAAIEIIAYGCAWLLSRPSSNADPAADSEADETADRSPLLKAASIDLVVLAPEAYYAPFDLTALERRLDAEVRALGASQGVALTFRYDVLHAGTVEASGGPPEALLALLDARGRLHP